MEIYVVQPGDNIELIASRFSIPVSDLIQYNELNNPYSLVPGQTIVIVYPQQTHTVKVGDTLGGIAKAYGITFMQLLRNNPYLANRENIYPGEILIISYNGGRDIITNGFAYPYINRDILVKTLPSLTYLSVLNYRAAAGGDIVTYYDDADIIRTSIVYGTIPLMMVTTLTSQGEPNLTVAFDYLINDSYQDNLINNMLKIMKDKGYHGVNMINNYINTRNIKWGQNTDPPGPDSSYSDYKEFFDYVIPFVQPDKVRLGLPVIDYDWTLPYIEEQTAVRALTTQSAVSQALDVGSAIQFDEPSQTPFYQYSQRSFNTEVKHIGWFVDARSIHSQDEFIQQYGLGGNGIWNIMAFYAQFWLINNSHYNIMKLIPDHFQD